MLKNHEDPLHLVRKLKFTVLYLLKLCFNFPQAQMVQGRVQQLKLLSLVSSFFVSFEDDEVVPSSKYHYWKWIQDTAGDGSEIYLDTGPLLVVTMMMIMTLILRTIC